jgi:serine protease Do
MSHFGLSSEKGVFVLEVWSDTPASKGGILPGDIIFELGGKRIENTTDLQHAIRRTKVDAKVIVKVVRYGAENTVEIIIERQPEDLSGRTYSAVRKSEEPVKFSLGLAVSDMNPEVAKSLGFEGEKGVLVIDVEEDSPAEHAGIKPGDLITKIGTKEIGTVMEFIDLLDTFLKQNGSVSIFVKNKGFLTLK